MLYRKNAAGLVDLKGLEKRIAHDIAQGLMRSYEQAIQDKGFSAVYDSLYKSETTTWENHPPRFKNTYVTQGIDAWISLAEYLEGFKLKSEAATKLFSRVQLKLSFDRSQNAWAELRPRARTADIFLYVHNVVVEETRKQGIVREKSLSSTIASHLGHELLHAADWAYQLALDKPLESKHPDLNSREEYLNTDTELKSWAFSIAREISQLPEMTSPFSRRYLTTSYFLHLLQTIPRAEDVKKIKPENRRKFLQRVLQDLRREATLEIEQERDEWRAEDGPSKYEFGKHFEAY